ncbi:MAG: lysophospholipid acyltransferase family protein [Actinomycetota bacterium]
MEFWFRAAEWSLLPPIKAWFNWRFEGLEHVPREGPVLVACNHISYFDPLAHGYFLVKAHRKPRYMAKAELYEQWLLKRVLEGAHQIKVNRGTGDQSPVANAKTALAAGECVVIYPEATVTRTPDFSPMEAKTGIARLTLSTGVPVIPIAVWGSQHVWQRDGARSLKFGRPVWLTAGPPLDFSDHSDNARDPETLRTVTGQVMDEITQLVHDLRSRYPKRWQ